MELVNFDGFCRGETYLPPPAHVTVLQASGLRRVDGGYGNEFGFDTYIGVGGHGGPAR